MTRAINLFCAGGILLASLLFSGCNRRSGEHPRYFNEFANSVTNSIPPGQLIAWADSLFTNSSPDLRYLPPHAWPPLIASTTPGFKPSYIYLDKAQNGTLSAIEIVYGGGFGTSAILILKHEPTNSLYTDKHVVWKNRLILHY